MKLFNIISFSCRFHGKQINLFALTVFVVVIIATTGQVSAKEDHIPGPAGTEKDLFFSDLNVQFNASVNNAPLFKKHEYESGAFIMPSLEELSDWHLSSNGQLPFAIIDKEDLARMPTLDVQAKRQLSEAMEFLLRYRVSYLKTMTNVEEQESTLPVGKSEHWQQSYSAEANMKWSLVRAKIGLSLEKNDTKNNDFSPTRQSWVAAVTLTPLDDLDLHLGFNYRNSNFSLMEIDEERKENHTSAVLRLSYMLSNDMYLSTEYQHTDTKSDDPQYDIQRDTLLLNVSMGF